MPPENKANVLFYDIESILLSFYAFAPGKQYLGHKQLIPGKSRYGIICISYSWNNGPVKVLKWDPVGRQEKLIKDFDALVSKADHIIGKNSNKFDNKMVNGIRIFTDQPGMPDWIKYTDDLEQQARKYFRLPSQSLDYMSDQLGLGGKVKMEFSDWVAIDQWMCVLMLKDDGMSESALEIYCQHMYRSSYLDVLRIGQIAFNKMCKYGAKDTKDTRTIWYHLVEHFEPKFNYSVFSANDFACRYEDCGAQTIIKRGTVSIGLTKYQRWICTTCRRCQKNTKYKG